MFLVAHLITCNLHVLQSAHPHGFHLITLATILTWMTPTSPMLLNVVSFSTPELNWWKLLINQPKTS